MNERTNEQIVIYEGLCFDLAQGRMNGVSNEIRTHSCRFANHYTTRGAQERANKEKPKQ